MSQMKDKKLVDVYKSCLVFQLHLEWNSIVFDVRKMNGNLEDIKTDQLQKNNNGMQAIDEYQSQME
jgi:hypothetical protein